MSDGLPSPGASPYSALRQDQPVMEASPCMRGLSPLPNRSPDSKTRGQTVSRCFFHKKLVWLAEIPCCTAPRSSILSCGRQAFPAAIEAFVSRLTFHQISSPPLWKRKGVIGSDLWAAVKLGQLFLQCLRQSGRAGIRETGRTRYPIVLHCPMQISFSP